MNRLKMNRSACSNGSACAVEPMEPRRLMSAAILSALAPLAPLAVVAPVVQQDWGDCPNVYRTTLAVNGPRHTIRAGFYLGASVDGEANGQPSASARLDDNTGVPDDEDGVRFPALFAGFVPGTVGAVIKVTASTAGMLDAWIDWGRDGTFNAGDRIAAGVPLVPGVNNVIYNVPAGAVAGVTYARFRLSDAGVASPYGFGGDGEVEDYGNDAKWTILAGNNPNPNVVASAPDSSAPDAGGAFNGDEGTMEAPRKTIGLEGYPQGGQRLASSAGGEQFNIRLKAYGPGGAAVPRVPVPATLQNRLAAVTTREAEEVNDVIGSVRQVVYTFDVKE